MSALELMWVAQTGKNKRYNMKKLSLVFCLIAILLTLFLCSGLPGRAYYFTCALVLIEGFVPLYLAFRQQKIMPKLLAIMALLSALAVIARVIIPLPSFKPIFAVIILSGIAFGAEAGFLVGAVSAFASNFFYGQGPFSPWQMLAYGLAGLIAGLLFMKRLNKKPLTMGIFGFFCILLIIGPLLDTCGIFFMLPNITKETVLPLYRSGLPVNFSQGLCTFVTIFLFGRFFLEKMDRVKLQYGIRIE